MKAHLFSKNRKEARKKTAGMGDNLAMFNIVIAVSFQSAFLLRNASE